MRIGAIRIPVALATAAAGLAFVVPAVSASGPVIPPARSLSYTGSEQTYTVPAHVALLELNVTGGAGGGGDVGMPLEGYLAVHGGQRLYAEVGENGGYNSGPTFGGGGAAGAFPAIAGCAGTDPTDDCGNALAGAGGGASDVRTCSEHAAHCPGGVSSQDTRLIVAGGGGGQGGDGHGPGYYCSGLPQKGTADNPQNPLPKGNPMEGPVPIATSKGIVIPGEPADYTYGPLKDTTAATGGSTTPGTGSSQSPCDDYETNNGAVIGEIFGGSIAGANGSGPDGAPGTSVTGHFTPQGPNGWIPGAGGGGGGGYTGGGGGSTGYLCTYSVAPPCYDVSGGQGGGGGASFVSKRVAAPYITEGPQPTGIQFNPLVVIDSPAAGAVYPPGKVVDAKWVCGTYQGSSCPHATRPSGSPIDTKPGKHRFTVTVSTSPNGVARASVTYTVR